MCGIVGYLGNKRAFDILVGGLHRLEYRGYDSAGVALEALDGQVNIYKSHGKVDDLEALCAGKNLDGTMGIAHTRWATHGEPNDINAHPQVSQTGRLAIVHNGTIENYRVLKETLEKCGYTFKSETDTEVLAQLIEYIMLTNDCGLLDAVKGALRQVDGAYAIAVIERGNPDVMVVAKQSSPLVIGIGEDETFVASDATPIVGYTDKVVYLREGEIAELRRGMPPMVQALGTDKPSELDVETLEMSIAEMEKGGYDTFMLKEIFQQPDTLTDCLRGRITSDYRHVVLSGVMLNRDKFLHANRIVIVACGTSWHAGLIGKRLIQEMCRIPVEVEYASEFRYGSPYLTDKDVVIAISQSGETADTLAAIKLAREKGAFVYGICNVVGSSIPRNTDSGTYIHVGPEIGVASTKAFTGQVTVLTLLALCIAGLKGTLPQEQIETLARKLQEMPDIVREVLKLDSTIKEMARIFTFARNFLYLGRGYNYPTALEGALKLKEISYIHAEGYPAAEMKHGPIALIDNDMPSVIIAPHDSLYDKIVSNVQQVKARGGIVVAIINRGNDAIKDLANYCLEIPEVPECLTPIVTSIPLQLLAYYVAIYKGRDVDKPRNLAKSVTVE
ncbi:MAG: glutamine--fructose-6-phosphate transaminase (isomerizing) [Prevotella sp.]|nr:glutamine--fructose-6-phosphate transaminase (isomerizing) [Prevotella sp.]